MTDAKSSNPVSRWKCESYCLCGSRTGHFERRDDGVWVHYDDIKPLQDEIERLQRELDGRGWCSEHVMVAGCPGCIEVEMRRLRAALERISRDEFGEEWAKDQDDYEGDYWRVVNIARQALQGLPVETTTLRCDCPTVKCDRCGKVEGPMCAMRVEEGDEWECPACNDRCDAAERAAVETTARTDSERLQWLANTVLCSDYGDNHHPSKLIGWRVMEFIAPVMYGASINEAIDAAMAQEKPKRRAEEYSARLDAAARERVDAFLTADSGKSEP